MTARKNSLFINYYQSIRSTIFRILLLEVVEQWKNVCSTTSKLLYAQLSQMYGVNREYICKNARTRQEAMQPIEQVFDYAMTDKEGISLFRKLK
jgi:hypothetical protein